MTEKEAIKPLTPKFRTEILASIEDIERELKTCQGNAFVNVQLRALDAQRKLFKALPDGYPIPVKRT